MGGHYAALYNCTGLTSVTIPFSVTSIAPWAFGWCTGLTSVEIPSRVTSIGFRAFYGCSDLASATILNANAEIGNSVFANCASGFTLRGFTGSTAEAYADAAGHVFLPFTELRLPAALTVIKANAFNGIAAEAVVIPASATEIAGNPFAGSANLQYICGYGDEWRSWAEGLGYTYIPMD